MNLFLHAHVLINLLCHRSDNKYIRYWRSISNHRQYTWQIFSCISYIITVRHQLALTHLGGITPAPTLLEWDITLHVINHLKSILPRRYMLQPRNIKSITPLMASNTLLLRIFHNCVMRCHIRSTSPDRDFPICDFRLNGGSYPHDTQFLMGTW